MESDISNVMESDTSSVASLSYGHQIVMMKSQFNGKGQYVVAQSSASDQSNVRVEFQHASSVHVGNKNLYYGPVIIKQYNKKKGNKSTSAEKDNPSHISIKGKPIAY